MHRSPYPYYSPNDFIGYPEQELYNQMPPSPQSFQSYSYEPFQAAPYDSDLYQAQHNQNPFQQLMKPTQPTNWPDFVPQGQPNQSFYPPPNQQPRPNFMSQFQGSDGQLDFNKMLSTVGQLANTVQQVTPVIQQVGSLMKSFKV